MSVAELIYDWNKADPQLCKPDRHIGFDDETLRDGLQSPSVCEPSVEKKIELLHLMDALGIDTADIGLPGAGGTHAAGVETMAREIAEQKLKIRPNCAARTHRNDILPIIEISQRVGIPIEACTFLGSSAIRFFALSIPSPQSRVVLIKSTGRRSVSASESGIHRWTSCSST